MKDMKNITEESKGNEKIPRNIIPLLWESLRKNRNGTKTKRGIPVSAILFNKNSLVISSFNNAKEISGSNTKSTHAEYLSIQVKGGEDLTIVVSIPPCGKCFVAIKKDGRVKRILWLFKKYGKDSVTKDDDILIERYIPRNSNEKKIIAKNKVMYFNSEKRKK